MYFLQDQDILWGLKEMMDAFNMNSRVLLELFYNLGHLMNRYYDSK